MVIGSRDPHWGKGSNCSNQEKRRRGLYFVAAAVALVGLGEVAGRL